MNLIIIVLLAFAAFLLLGIPLSENEQPPAPSQEIFDVAAAIAKAEGSNPDWNNPGNLTTAFGYPTLGTVNSDGVLKFQSAVDGWNALYHQLSLIVSGNSRYSLTDTIATFGQGYSGGDPNWAVNVATELQTTPNATLGSVLT
jgi:hypothetical protein